MRNSAPVIALVALLMAPTVPADDGGDGTAPAPPEQIDSPSTQPRAYPRKVYDVDDIGMIIGGASEDAKAKVSRLPVQD